MSEDSKFFLKDSDVPKQWYNLGADLKEPMSPPLNPGTKQPIGPDDLAPLFPMELIMQEVTQERYIDIPGPVLEAYSRWRSTLATSSAASDVYKRQLLIKGKSCAKSTPISIKKQPKI